jgi:transmembrane sensor
MTVRRPIDAKLAEEAAEWVERLQRDSSEVCDAQFRDWLLLSPNHIDEFLVAKLTFSLFQRFDPARQFDVDELVKHASDQVIPLRAPPESEQPALALSKPSRILRYVGLSLVAAAVFASIGMLGFYLYFTSYSTGIGEQRTVRLADGSTLELNARSKVRVHLGKDVRSVRLIEGEALFKVAHDPDRPFRVSTKTAMIEAVGTQFDVYLTLDSGTRVAVVEGRVRVIGDSGERSPSSTTLDTPKVAVAPSMAVSNIGLLMLAAGEQANISQQGRIFKAAQPHVPDAIAWRNGRLIFHDAPVGEVIKEFGRYSEFHFSLVGNGLPQRRITGVFQAYDPQALVSLFESDHTVQVTHVSNGIVVAPRQ